MAMLAQQHQSIRIVPYTTIGQSCPIPNPFPSSKSPRDYDANTSQDSYPEPMSLPSPVDSSAATCMPPADKRALAQARQQALFEAYRAEREREDRERGASQEPERDRPYISQRHPLTGPGMPAAVGGGYSVLKFSSAAENEGGLASPIYATSTHQPFSSIRETYIPTASSSVVSSASSSPSLRNILSPAPDNETRPEPHDANLGGGAYCAICDKFISRRGDMPRHRRTHLPVKDKSKLMHRCPFPGCRFKNLQKSNVDTHIRTHTGAKTQCCPDCDFKTVDPGSLTRHRKRLHGYIPRPRNKKGPAATTNSTTAASSSSSSSSSASRRKARTLASARASASASTTSRPGSVATSYESEDDDFDDEHDQEQEQDDLPSVPRIQPAQGFRISHNQNGREDDDYDISPSEEEEEEDQNEDGDGDYRMNTTAVRMISRR